MKTSYIFITLLLYIVLSSCSNNKQTDAQTIHYGKLCYRGEVLNGKPNGYGVLTIGDSTLYSGTWKDGKRSGYGTTTDSLGRIIDAVWKCDTIVKGTCRDSAGTYSGEIDTLLHATGHGTWKGIDGSFYTGHWNNNKPNGFGCGIEKQGRVKAGDWRNGKYRGERMLHTSDRIYGIDVSKYQHEQGKRRYVIDWASLRITGLGSGNISKGMVDYSITFAYIKATEGTTVRNKYYGNDYRQAKLHGIHTGAYHFFSPSSPVDKQAYFFINNMKYEKGDLPPVLDLEPSDAQIAQMGGTEEMFRRVRKWLSIVNRHTGRRPVLYVGQGFVNRYLSQAPDIKKKYPVWIARYGKYRPDIKLAFWQLTPYGKVKGIHGDVDINVFNGYNTAFKEFIGE